MRNLDFADAASYASGMVDTTLQPNNSDPDAATNSGWNPIGTDGNRFNTRFEGNGYTISNLYGRLLSGGWLGIFGVTGSNSVIRSVGVAAARLYGSDAGNDINDIGALMGINWGTIVASYATGTVNGGASAGDIGGLVGSNRDTIVASYASGTINGGAGADNIGGLVGGVDQNSDTSIIPTMIASYATGTINGGTGADDIGGLVGETGIGITMASYASGTANGDADDDRIGGWGGSIAFYHIIASYASGAVDGGANNDALGSLVGALFGGSRTATYGFGSATGETAGIDNSDPRPAGVAFVGSGINGARMLTLDSAGEQWNQVVITNSNTTTITTMDVWDFGDNTQAPALRYADYDGPNNDTYGCGNGSMADIVIPSVVATPTGPMTITCGVTLLPEQER